MANETPFGANTQDEERAGLQELMRQQVELEITHADYKTRCEANEKALTSIHGIEQMMDRHYASDRGPAVTAVAFVEIWNLQNKISSSLAQTFQLLEQRGFNVAGQQMESVGRSLGLLEDIINSYRERHRGEIALVRRAHAAELFKPFRDWCTWWLQQDRTRK